MFNEPVFFENLASDNVGKYGTARQVKGDNIIWRRKDAICIVDSYIYANKNKGMYCCLFIAKWLAITPHYHCTYIVYILTDSMKQSPHLINKFLAFYGT